MWRDSRLEEALLIDMRLMRCIPCLFAAACVWWAGPHAAPLHAQVLRGELVDRVTQQPLTRGFLVLIDANDNELVRGRVDGAGASALGLAGLYEPPAHPGVMHMAERRPLSSGTPRSA